MKPLQSNADGPPEGQVFSENGVYAEKYGDGPPILLVPGNRGAVPVFSKLIALLHERYTLIAIDLPGHRYGPLLTERFVLDKRASVEYCLKALDLMGIDKAWICGHSLGGMIAMEMGLQCPERVKGMVVLEGFATLSERQNECFRMMAFPGSTEDMRYEVFQALQYGPGVLWHYEYDISDRLHELNNVMELVGQAEEGSATQFESWKSRFRTWVGRHWVCKQVPHSGHFVMVENPGFVAAEMVKFIEETD